MGNSDDDRNPSGVCNTLPCNRNRRRYCRPGGGSVLYLSTAGSPAQSTAAGSSSPSRFLSSRTRSAALQVREPETVLASEADFLFQDMWWRNSLTRAIPALEPGARSRGIGAAVSP